MVKFQENCLIRYFLIGKKLYFLPFLNRFESLTQNLTIILSFNTNSYIDQNVAVDFLYCTLKNPVSV